MSDILNTSQIRVPGNATTKEEAIREAGGLLVRYDPPIDWDGNDVRFVVGIAGYEGGHLEILSKVAVIFSDTDEVDKIIAAGSGQEVYDLLNTVNVD